MNIKFLFPLVLLFFSFYSCQKNASPTIVTTELNLSLQKTDLSQKRFIPSKQVMDTFIVVEKGKDRAMDCSIRWENGWLIDHFEPKSGKFLGIWPTTERRTNLSRFKELKDEYGFTYVLLQSHINYNSKEMFNNAGFSDNKILVHLNKKYNNPASTRINQFGNVFGYYIDEPYNVPSYNFGEYFVISTHIKNNTTSKFYIGDYTPNNCLDKYVSLSDGIMCSTYKTGWTIPLTCSYRWWPEDLDQRPLWSKFKDRYKTKNFSNWVAAHKDHYEYRNLLGKAKNLGLSTVWYYQLQDTPEYTGFIADVYSRVNIQAFCSAAWEAGYLRRFSQYIRIYYKCIYGSDCNKCVESNNESWVISHIHYFGITREDFIQN